MNLLNAVKVVTAGLIFALPTAFADVKIQNAKYKAAKNAVFVKGKVDGANKVYVVNSATNQSISTLSAPKGQFKGDIEVSEDSVPCLIQVQTNAPGGGFFGRNNSTPGDYSISVVDHAPGC